MEDIFTSSVTGLIAISLATDLPVIIQKGSSYKGQMSYDVSVPILDNGKARLCNTTYSDKELSF